MWSISVHFLLSFLPRCSFKVLLCSVCVYSVIKFKLDPQFVSSPDFYTDGFKITLHLGGRIFSKNLENILKTPHLQPPNRASYQRVIFILTTALLYISLDYIILVHSLLLPLRLSVFQFQSKDWQHSDPFLYENLNLSGSQKLSSACFYPVITYAYLGLQKCIRKKNLLKAKHWIR